MSTTQVQATQMGAKKRLQAEKHQLPLAVRENLVGYLFLLPWFIGLLALTLGPMLGSLYLSFTRYDLLSAP